MPWLKKTIFLMAALGLLVGALLTRGSEAETELILTWRAANYAPDFYQGKKLPMARSAINVALQATFDHRLFDLADKEIRWYVDGQLVASGLGRHSLTFSAPHLGQATVTIRVSLVNSRGNVNQFLVIPLAQPEAVIDPAQLPRLAGWFYFFNISSPEELTTTWEDLGPRVELRVENMANPLEFANANLIKNP